MIIWHQDITEDLMEVIMEDITEDLMEDGAAIMVDGALEVTTAGGDTAIIEDQ
jgi:hypothetical protein